jgi:type I restriction enzyme S subunit
VQNGFAFDSTRFNPSKGPPLIRIRSLKLGIETETRYGGEYEDKYMVRVGDLLIGMDGEFGCYEWKGEPSLLNQRVCRLQGFSGELLPRFLFYGVNDYLKAIEDVTGFATVKHLSSKQILAIEFPVPPLAEQRRIVGVLDEAFASLATAQAHAAQNLQNARALFESHLNAVFTQRGVGWKQTTLGEEIDLLSGFAFKSSQYTTNEKDIRLLRGDNIIQGCLRWDDVKRWPANDTKEYRRYWLSEGDVVLAMDRPWVKAGMKYAMMTSNDLPCLLVQRTARLRGGENLDNRFLMRLIGSAAFTSHILGVQTGIGVPHISGQQIKDFGFSCPSVAEQRRIADNLDALAAEIQRLTRIYEQKLAALAELKKSLLHQAFSGEI